MKLFRNLLIATAAVAVFSGVSAFAEGSDNTSYQFNVDADVATNVVSVAEADLANVIADMGDQVTVVVVPAKSTDISDGNIYYINQDANSAAATMLTDMGTKALAADTDYEVWVGGSNGTIKQGFFTTKEDAPEYPLGDANLSGGVDGADATVIMDYGVGLVELTDTAFKYADVTGNGSVDGADATDILDYGVGLPSYVEGTKTAE